MRLVPVGHALNFHTHHSLIQPEHSGNLGPTETEDGNQERIFLIVIMSVSLVAFMPSFLAFIAAIVFSNLTWTIDEFIRIPL
jgi:lipopolysaccharide/colanic/teichoic acid biosynthesis glycosyltransferase